jgi:hypothetical protein
MNTIKKLKVKGPMDIPGWTQPVQHKCYSQVVNELPENPKVFEIGTGWGRSTWAWLNVLPKDTLFYALDFFRMRYEEEKIIHDKTFSKRIKSRNLSQREIFDEIISQNKNKDIIKQIWQMDIVDWINSDQCRTDWDMVYLDDDHSYDAVKRWLELFKTVPIVCGDDYNKYEYPLLVKAVDEYVATHNCTKEVLPGSFFIIRNNV